MTTIAAVAATKPRAAAPVRRGVFLKEDIYRRDRRRFQYWSGRKGRQCLCGTAVLYKVPADMDRGGLLEGGGRV